MTRTKPTVEQLWARPDVTVSEAVRITGRARETIMKWVKDKQVRFFQEGASIRIVTQSIKDRAEKLADEQSGGGRW